mgnify:CR=1 FL=1
MKSELIAIIDRKIAERRALMNERITLSMKMKCQHQLQVLLEIKKELEPLNETR